jgi:hypothetical protein
MRARRLRRRMTPRTIRSTIDHASMRLCLSV